MKRILFVILLGFSLACHAAQQAPDTPGKNPSAQPKHDGADCGMLYGIGHFLSICAPHGWILDNSVLSEQHIYAVFYPKGSSFSIAKDTGTFMYANTARREESSTIENFMKADEAEARQQYPQAVIQKGKLIPIKKETPAPVLLFLPGGFGRYEAVAYIESPKVITMLVMTSKSKKSFDKDYPAFEELVKSYVFFGADVTINGQKK
jgi:hypothetical protein